MTNVYLISELSKNLAPPCVRASIGSLEKVFAQAVSLVREEHGASLFKQGHIPPLFVDCGNTLFDKSGEEPVINPALLHLLIALQEGGYKVQLMSDEPLHYLPILHEELHKRKRSPRLFEDDYGLSIMRKQAISAATKGLILIDNDLFSVPVKIKRRIYLDDPAFQKALVAFNDLEKAVLPESWKPEMLWNNAGKGAKNYMPGLNF